MKRARKKIFLEELSKTPVMSAVCSKLNISRETIYRWQKEDSDFKSKYEEVYQQGTGNINDLAKSKLITKINEGDIGAIKYWLDNRDTEFAKPRLHFLKLIEKNQEDINKVTVQIVKSKEDLNN